MSDSLQILKDFTERMKKSLSAEVIHSITKRHRMAETDPEVRISKDITTVRNLGTRNMGGGKFERVIMPTEVVRTEAELTKSEVFHDCGSCGYMYKSSMDSCPRCLEKSVIREAVPFYKR